MKTNKSKLTTQRQIIDKKLIQWLPLRADKRPPTGWLKAIRGALGINARQLSNLLDVDHSSVLRLEQRESQGKITIDLLEKAANAMGCKLVYAVVPIEAYGSLDAIVDEKAKQAAKDILVRVEHSMRLEQQGTNDLKIEIEKMASELKSKMDSKIWTTPTKKKKFR